MNLINYWVDEKTGVVMCLSRAKDSSSIIQTHKEAYDLVPAYVSEVKEGDKKDLISNVDSGRIDIDFRFPILPFL